MDNQPHTKGLHDVLRDCTDEQRDVIGEEPLVRSITTSEFWRNSFMENTQIAELARKIYKAHSRALDIIFEHRPDSLMRLTRL